MGWASVVLLVHSGGVYNFQFSEGRTPIRKIFVLVVYNYYKLSRCENNTNTIAASKFA